MQFWSGIVESVLFFFFNLHYLLGGAICVLHIWYHFEHVADIDVIV